jgi:hypothetical protein
MAFCLAEDRASGEIGLRLAILSLVRHCPDTPVYVYRPPLSPRFAPWLRQFPQVILNESAPVGAYSWNCKPQALKPLFEKGHRELIWLDSDIIVTRDCRALFSALDERVLSIAQEPTSLPHQGTAARTRGWNLEPRRSLPITLNSAVLRVTVRHERLLDRWAEHLADPRYVATQTLPLENRPLHLMGDQDVLNALLGSPEFADIPLQVLGSGTDIIHAGGALGYSLSERLHGTLKPMPAFVHAAAGKPWLWLGGDPHWSKRNFFGWHRRLLQELSPYVAESRRYRAQLGDDSSWMDRRTATGTVLRALGFGHFALRGLPLTIAATIMTRAARNRP